MKETRLLTVTNEKVLFPDESEYQVDESERNLLEKSFTEDGKSSVAWYFKVDKTDCNNMLSPSSYLTWTMLNLLKNTDILNMEERELL